MKHTCAWHYPEDSEWNAYFQRLPRSTLPQSFAYGEALATLGQGVAKRILIEMDGVPAGVTQLIETKALGGALHGVALDRGPLWFESFGSPDHVAAFFETFSKKFGRRPLRLRRVIPEIAANDETEIPGLRRRADIPSYETSVLDIGQDLEELRAGLRKNWRGALSKAEGIACSWDDTGKDAPWLLKHYQINKAQKGYPGPSVELMKELAKRFAAENGLLIGTASLAQKPIGAILILRHGTGATYQIGWTSEEGRTRSAHHLLLWEALKILKNKGVKNFDLGGFNEKTGGIRAFKEGMGGETLRLAGFYA